MRFFISLLTIIFLYIAALQPCLASSIIQDNSITQAKLHSSIAEASDIMNCSLATSVGSSALTITLKNAAGSTPSTGSPCKISFRNATSATGTYSAVSVTAATSLVVSSGSTLGSTGGAGVTEYVYVYALNNAGSIELGVSTKWFDTGSVVSSTAEGGAGAADSGTVIYSTTARSNVAARLIGRIAFTEAVAGTWATAPTEISVGTFQVKPQSSVLPRAFVRFDPTSASSSDLTGTYSRTTTTVTVTATAHGLVVGNRVYLNFTSGTAVDGAFVVTSVADANTFTVTHGTSGSTSGNVTLERITITSSYGVNSVAHEAVGTYTINFAPCMPDANYAFFGTLINGSLTAAFVTEGFVTTLPAACYIQVEQNFVNTAQNHTYSDLSPGISWIFFR